MRKLAFLILALFLVSNFVSGGTILSDRSIDHDLGNGKHQIQVFAAPQFRLDPDSNRWLPFTQSVKLFSNSSGLFINFSDQQRTRRLFNFGRLPAACTDYSVQDDGGSYEFTATCDVPAGKGTFLKNFSGVIADRFIGGTAFQARGIFIDFDKWNINTGAFNSSVEFINYSDGKLGVNLSWSSNQSQTIELDPLVSAGAADDVTLIAIGGSNHPYIKFLSSVVPLNQTIADAELYLNKWSEGNFDPGASTIFMRNSTTDWKTSDSAGTIYGVNYTNDSDTNWTLLPIGQMGWFGWNVTKSFTYAYLNSFNASYTFNYTKPLVAPSTKQNNTSLVTGNGAACSGSGCLINFNSSDAATFQPQLNITYYVPPVPSMLTCSDGSYIKNQSGQFYFYSNQTGVSCQIRILNENLSVVIGYSNMTESVSELRWFNYTLNLSNIGRYWASFNCSNGYSASNDLSVVSSCASSAIGPQESLKKSQIVTLIMPAFFGTFQLALLACIAFFLIAYWGFGKAAKENEEQQAKEPIEQPAGPLRFVRSNSQDKVSGFLGGVSTLSFFYALLFCLIFLGLSLGPGENVASSVNYTYANYTSSSNATICQGGIVVNGTCVAGSGNTNIVSTDFGPIAISSAASSSTSPSEFLSNIMGWVIFLLGLYIFIVFVWFLLEGARPIWERFTRGGR